MGQECLVAKSLEFRRKLFAVASRGCCHKNGKAIFILLFKGLRLIYEKQRIPLALDLSFICERDSPSFIFVWSGCGWLYSKNTINLSTKCTLASKKWLHNSPRSVLLACDHFSSFYLFFNPVRLEGKFRKSQADKLIIIFSYTSSRIKSTSCARCAGEKRKPTDQWRSQYFSALRAKSAWTLLNLNSRCRRKSRTASTVLKKAHESSVNRANVTRFTSVYGRWRWPSDTSRNCMLLS
jgi:hypothetical protein